MNSMKRSDECFACKRRACYERVVSPDGGKEFDEVACQGHAHDLHKYAENSAPKVMKYFISSTGKQKRGVMFTPN